MVRTLDTALTTSLNALTHSPAISLTIEDHSIHYAPFQTPATADGWNDACIASDNSIVRVYINRGGTNFDRTCFFQRITDPTIASQWSSWTALPGSAGNIFQDGSVAISNNAGTLRIFCQRGTGGNNLWVWTSTDNGNSWTGPVSVLSPPANALIKGIGSSGNNDVFLIYDIVGGEAIGCSFYSGGVWSGLSTWTLPALAYGGGLAVAFANSLYTLVYTDTYTIYSCTRTIGGVWTASTVIAPATSTAIGRLAPRLSFADGLYTLACIESDTGVLTGSVYSYPRLRQSSDLIHWSNGTIVHDLPCSYGVFTLKLPVPNTGTAGSRYYLGSLSTILSAQAFQATSSTKYLDVSSAILSYQRHEQEGHPSRLELLLDNTKGGFNAFVTSGSNYQPIGLNSSLVLSEGYKTGNPPTVTDVVKVGTYHIQEIYFLRTPIENQIRLIAFDLSRYLDLTSRYQYTYTNQPLGYLIVEIAAKAGLFSPVLPATAQISQLVPNFVLHAGQTYRQALDELCTTYELYYFLDQNETLQVRELSGSDPSVWTYQPEIELVSFGSNDQRANHIIVSGKPPGSGLASALTTAEVYDEAHMHLVGIEQLLHHTDLKLTTTTQCATKASFLLAQQTRSQQQHALTVPLNPALQLLDVVTLVDSIAPAGSGQNLSARILSLLAHFDAQHAMHTLTLGLSGL